MSNNRYKGNLFEGAKKSRRKRAELKKRYSHAKPTSINKLNLILIIALAVVVVIGSVFAILLLVSPKDEPSSDTSSSSSDYDKFTFNPAWGEYEEKEESKPFTNDFKLPPTGDTGSGIIES